MSRCTRRAEIRRPTGTPAGLTVLLVAVAIGAAGCGGGAPGRRKAAQRPIARAAACSVTVAAASGAAGATRALDAAGSGGRICLQAGHYGAIALSNFNPSATVTLAPAAGAQVTVGPLSLTGPNHDLTFEGLSLGPVSVTGAASRLAFIDNHLSGLGEGFYFYAGQGNEQDGIQVLGNHIDHLHAADLSAPGAGQCVTIAGGATEERNFTLNHNVCGPRIGDHYFQVGGIDGLTAEDNAFLGPVDPEALKQQTHNNVLQVFGDSRNINFSHNVMRNTESRGQTVLIEEGHFDNVTVDGNLWQEDPTCLKDPNCFSYAIDIYNAHGLSFQNNTVIDSHWGVLLTDVEPQSYPSGRDYQISHNIVVGTSGNYDITFQHCATHCTFDYNVTADDSAKQAGSHRYVTGWKPVWSAGAAHDPVGLDFAAGYRKAG
jgi:hypothetical protein